MNNDISPPGLGLFRRGNILRLAFVGVILFTLLGMAAPNLLDQKFARVYGSVGEPDDMLLLVHYEIEYTGCPPTCPADPANETFLAMYNDVSQGYGIKAATPYVYVASGYGEGAISIYLDATEAAGITWGDADTSKILGNPSSFSSPPVDTETIEWRAQTGAAATLAEDIASLASTLEASAAFASVDLIDSDMLTSAGQEYFEAVIPNLGVYAPTLFSGGLSNPDFVERDYDMSYRDELDNFWTGTALANSWDSSAAFLGLPVIFVRTLATLILGSVAAWYIIRVTGESMLAFPVMGICIAGGTIINWVPLQLTAVMGFMGILIIGFTLWLKRAT